MDNQATESSLDVTSAGAALAGLFSGDPPEKREAPVEAAVDAVEPPATEVVEDAGPEMVTVDIDGYEVELPKDKAEKLKAERLMQADYTRKTMAAADERKAASAEHQKAIAERGAYAANLQRMQAQLEGALQDQAKDVNWEHLLNNDPVEYLRQQHLAQTRQAALQQNYTQQQQVNSQIDADRAAAHESHLAQQQEALLAKLPDWRDPAKAAAERVAIRDYLQSQGFEASELAHVTDARSVLMARKAMLYDQMVSKASAAAKKVATLPSRVVTPGAGESQNLDKRGAQFQRLSKSGKAEDAAALFAGIL